MEYLGFWVTCKGIRPLNEKVKAVTNMTPPTSKMRVCLFIGLKFTIEICGKTFTHIVTANYSDVQECTI